MTDPQGRTVRAKDAARISQNGKQITLWADIRTANQGHMERAFGQRRRQILGDCRQLKADVDSYNDNRQPEEPLQVIFDFTLDLAELEAAQTPRDHLPRPERFGLRSRALDCPGSPVVLRWRMADIRLWTGHLTKPMQVCFCDGGWVCEQHPDKLSPHDDCDGAGMACPRSIQILLSAASHRVAQHSLN